MTTPSTTEESPFAESTKFWRLVMEKTKERWPTDESFQQGSVRELIDCCFEVHKELLTSREAAVRREMIQTIELHKQANIENILLTVEDRVAVDRELEDLITNLTDSTEV